MYQGNLLYCIYESKQSCKKYIYVSYAELKWSLCDERWIVRNLMSSCLKYMCIVEINFNVDAFYIT